MKRKMSVKRNHGLKERISMRCLQLYAAVMCTLVVPATAHAKLSDWGKSIAEEIATIAPILVIILSTAGVLICGGSWLSIILAKKNNRPVEWQWWGVGGGAVLLIFVPFVIAIAESFSGQSAEAAMKSVLG